MLRRAGQVRGLYQGISSHTFRRNVSVRAAAAREEAVRDALRSVVDQDTGKDVVTSGAVKDVHVEHADGVVRCRLESVPGRQEHARLADAAREAVARLDWVSHAQVEVRPPPPRARNRSVMKDGLREVGAVVAVYSCKGGVGKSTVATNLALALTRRGARVGLFDGDLYGPSVPYLVGQQGASVQPAGAGETADRLAPVHAHGLATMSFGYAARGRRTDGSAAIMRGPMASNVMRQMLAFTQWGPLDFLIVDFPPGTGDIQLTLTSALDITTAVVVTTPHRLSHMDTEKGVEMMAKLKVPTAVVVENMGWAECAVCGASQPGAPAGGVGDIARRFGIPAVVRLPLDGRYCAESEPERPHVLLDAEEDERVAAIAEAVAAETARCRASPAVQPDVQFVPGAGFRLRVFDSSSAREHVLPPRTVRLACRCAACVDEVTGERLLEEARVPADVEPARVLKRGNYGVAVQWSDGHDSSVYTFDQLQALAETAA